MNPRDIEHPDITAIMRNGYPKWAEPKSIYCCECDKCLDDEEAIYEDSDHEYLCESCLLALYKKWW